MYKLHIKILILIALLPLVANSNVGSWNKSKG